MSMLFKNVLWSKERFVKIVYERWEEDNESSDNDSTVY